MDNANLNKISINKEKIQNPKSRIPRIFLVVAITITLLLLGISLLVLTGNKQQSKQQPKLRQTQQLEQQQESQKQTIKEINDTTIFAEPELPPLKGKPTGLLGTVESLNQEARTILMKLENEDKEETLKVMAGARVLRGNNEGIIPVKGDIFTSIVVGDLIWVDEINTTRLIIQEK